MRGSVGSGPRSGTPLCTTVVRRPSDGTTSVNVRAVAREFAITWVASRSGDASRRRAVRPDDSSASWTCDTTGTRASRALTSHVGTTTVLTSRTSGFARRSERAPATIARSPESA